MRGHPPSQALRQHSAPPGAIREAVTPAAPILSRRRPRHGPSAVSPAFGGKTFSLFPRPAFTVRGRSGPPAMGGSLWGRTPGVPQARPGASQAHRPGRPPSCGPILRQPSAHPRSLLLYVHLPLYLHPIPFYSAVCFRSPLPRRERAFPVPSPVTGPSPRHLHSAPSSRRGRGPEGVDAALAPPGGTC